MADTYLPADVRNRITDVMKARKMTQRELALRINVNESTISRFLSGKTEKLSEESVIRIARVFNVSTDFQMFSTLSSMLLGINKSNAAVQAARTANAIKVPAYQADQTTIQNTFMTVINEIKREAGNDLAAARSISKETTEKLALDNFWLELPWWY